MFRLFVSGSLFVALLLVQGCATHQATEESREPCSAGWYQAVEQKVSSGDGLGHGPDLGSDEWRSVIEFKLGLRGSALVPERSGREWCDYIHRAVFEATL